MSWRRRQTSINHVSAQTRRFASGVAKLEESFELTDRMRDELKAMQRGL
jgi:hypothetical protein